ncbi:MAG TPA: DNA ligase D [Devosiaceae bacterium]|jgi:bifunctional non-homologous end joining protein LigD|nr:DNA ligase D [Devosiaceae bacterium]
MAVKADQLLRDYRAKRDFAKTQEPSGKSKTVKGGASETLSFVVQKHAASRLHYDFRLELDGVLKSWAVAKGPSTNPADKRLAVRTEDHPLDYGGFEGTIPEGEYGGGTVMLWDEGTWEPVGDPHEGLAKGDLKFRLKGKRMKGEWVLVHMKGRDTKTRSGSRENWLLIKHRDKYATEEDGLTEKFTTSVETGRDLDGIAKGNKPRKASANKSEAKSQVWTGGKAVALPEFRPPQLATLVDEIPQGRDWLFEMKYDGYRALAAVAGPEVRLYTRNANDWTRQFGRLVEPLSKLTKGSALLDGEICSFKEGRTDFSTLKDALSTGGDLVYLVFDLLEQDGVDLTKLPLLERKTRLRKLLGKPDPKSVIQYSEHVQGQGEKVFEAMCAAGQEGVIAKRADDRYRSERTKSWLKIKCIQRQEFVIGGWRPSDKKRGFASLLLGTWEDGKLVYRGRVGTGFTVSSSAELQAKLDERGRPSSPFAGVPRDISRKAHWVEPELVGEIAFTEFTPDGVLRHPSFLGLREDKPARQISREKPVPATPKAPKPQGKARPAASVELTNEAGISAAERLGVRLTSPDRVVYPGLGVTKAQVVAYYEAVAERMLPFIAERPLSLVRCPRGRARHCFFQKHDSGGFPEQMKKVAVTEKDGHVEDYFYIDDLAGIVAGVQMNTLEYHLWGSRIDLLEKPERIIFDIDPDEGLGFEHVRQAALDIRGHLSEIGLESFPMVTGGKGIHVISPLQRRAEWPDVKAFCKSFAQRLADAEPDRFVANMSKAKRKGRLFIDYLRNERGATAIAPFSTRSREGAPCAVPISWEEVGTIAGANIFSLGEAAAKAAEPDPWPDYFKLKQAITAKMLKAVSK